MIDFPDFNVRAFSLRNIRVDVIESMDRPCWEVRISGESPEIETGHPGPVVNRVSIHHGAPREQVVRMVKHALQTFVLHELTECLFIDGLRADNPHPEDKHIVHPLPLPERLRGPEDVQREWRSRPDPFSPSALPARGVRR